MELGIQEKIDIIPQECLSAKATSDSPRKYKVVLYNDDFTPMEFVVRLLKDVFHLAEEVATNIMLQVHYNGKGICGYFVKDIAQTKANILVEKARNHSYPLLCKAEES